MTGPRFQSLPPLPKRGVVRWILLLLHALIFAAVVFAYPSLRTSVPDLVTGNLAWLLLTLWACLLVVHLLLVALGDLRESIGIFRKLRRRKAYLTQLEMERKRRQMSRAVRADQGPRIYDEKDLEPS